ncbi:MAG: radical SAM protein, partial [bacterium]|nr:radical SAM protein [bacterium]
VAITSFFCTEDFDLIGVSLRISDDCFAASQHNFLHEFQQMVVTLRKASHAPIIVGGAGFSVMPEAILSICPADAGVWNDGEFILPQIADCLQKKLPWQSLPNLIYQDHGEWRHTEQILFPLHTLPMMTRRWLDNPRYFREGGQVGIETKRGCAGACIYCADPIAKGRRVRHRPPSHVVMEWEALVAMGISHFHCCDCEFNLPPAHALAVCEALIARGLEKHIQWYAYCSPTGFEEKLAQAMRQAGCVGINFGVDSGDPGMLRRLKRDFTPAEIQQAIHCCHQENIAVMVDLLLGAPGETVESITQTLNFIKSTEADRIGISLGVRLYPETELTQTITHTDPHYCYRRRADLLRPVFYIEPAVAEAASGLIKDLVGDDPRFFYCDPSAADKNYNYNGNGILVQAIQKGMRGAYWDILRQLPLTQGKEQR